MIKRLLLAGALLMASIGGSQAMAATTLNVTYYTIAGGDPDTGSGFCCGTFSNEVNPTLGLDGLPVYNPGYGGPALNDVNLNGELTWWSPAGSPGGGNANVTQTGTGVVTLPINFTTFFPPNGGGSNDTNSFQTAIFKGVLHVPVAESVSFNLGSDDDAFLALNNTIVDQNGGVHALATAPVVTSVLAPGFYDLTLFFADRDQTQAQLQFGINTAGVTLNGGVPEPATWAMMLMGLAMIGGGLRMARRNQYAAVTEA